MLRSLLVVLFMCMAAPFAVAKTAAIPVQDAKIVSQQGVKDMLIRRQTPKLNLEAHYPHIGLTIVDEDISSWAKQLVDNFQSEYSEEDVEQRMPYEFKATYTLTRPIPTVLSVIWEIASYTGGAHGNLDIVSSSYDLQTEAPIGLFDIFQDLDTALDIMSSYSYKKLNVALGQHVDESMLRAGTTPDADNFSSFALIPEGLRIFFQPYQVAPWAAGPQTLDIPLEELSAAGPRLNYWGKAAAQ